MFEALLKRDRAIVSGGLIFVACLSWLYLFAGAGMDMSNSMSNTMQTEMTSLTWSFQHAVVVFVMWWVMMVAMMLPSAAPMILLFSTVNRGAKKGVPTLIFAASYLLIWGGFSLLATVLQWSLNAMELLDPMMASSSHLFSGGLLTVAGVYQFTPVKDACLRHCRTPVQFVMENWKPGRIGAVRMGLLHGAFCLGCCWFLMALLFVGGAMNMLWIGGLALYVLIEKCLPHGQFVGKLTGMVLIIWGTLQFLN